MKFRNSPMLRHDISSLKVLGCAGEPINPEAWLWYFQTLGGTKCPIVDTYWQTETGGPCITPLPGATPTKPGSATFPFFGIVPELLDEEGHVIEGEGEGYLVFKQAWPGMMRTVYGDHARFEETYFRRFPGYYYTGDGAKRDADGYLWITGRVDDMLNVSGHLLSTAQVESAILEHKCVSEAAAVPIEHPVKGEALYCFVVLNEGLEMNKSIIGEINDKVRDKIGPIATPEKIQLAQALPKTRSGKIMRRILRKIAAGETDFGDISTMADESVLASLIKPPKN
jgi:acetyl-CoA synthetase